MGSRRPVHPQHEGQSQSAQITPAKTCQSPLRSRHHIAELFQRFTPEILEPELTLKRVLTAAPNPTNLEPSVSLSGHDDRLVELAGWLLLSEKSPVVEDGEIHAAEPDDPARERNQPGPTLRAELDGTGQPRLTPHLLERRDVVGGQAIFHRSARQKIVQRERLFAVGDLVPVKTVPYVRIHPHQECVLPEKKLPCSRGGALC